MTHSLGEFCWCSSHIKFFFNSPAKTCSAAQHVALVFLWGRVQTGSCSLTRLGLCFSCLCKSLVFARDLVLHYSPKPVQTETLWLLSPRAAFCVHGISPREAILDV